MKNSNRNTAKSALKAISLMQFLLIDISIINYI